MVEGQWGRVGHLEGEGHFEEWDTWKGRSTGEGWGTGEGRHWRGERQRERFLTSQ